MRRLAAAVGSVGLRTVVSLTMVDPTTGQALSNVKGMDAARLVGSQCRATFWVPGSRSETGSGAVGLEFSEANGLLSLVTSSRFGADAYRKAMDLSLELQPVGPARTLEVDGDKVMFVDAKGGKFQLGLKADGTFKGTVDPRGTPGRENWNVANVEGKCATR
jgi:hypothetical protein